MQNYNIPRTEILKLYESSLNEVSAHSIGQWLKIVTENQFMVVPRKNIEVNNRIIADLSDKINKLSCNKKRIEEWF